MGGTPLLRPCGGEAGLRGTHSQAALGNDRVEGRGQGGDAGIEICQAALGETHSQAALGNDTVDRGQRTEDRVDDAGVEGAKQRFAGRIPKRRLGTTGWRAEGQGGDAGIEVCQAALGRRIPKRRLGTTGAGVRFASDRRL